MSPRCFQQLPFSTFSLTFFCFDKGFCPSTTAAWEVSLAGWWPQPSQHGLLLLLLLTQDKLAFKTQKILYGRTRVSPMTALFIPACQGWRVPASVSVLSWGSAGRGEEEAGVWDWRSSHKNWTSPSRPGLFNTHTPARGGTGVSSASAFHSSVWALRFCWHWVFCAVARSAASGFLFLDASVGACSFYMKRRKPVGIVKLGAFSTKAGCIFSGVGGRLA